MKLATSEYDQRIYHILHKHFPVEVDLSFILGNELFSKIQGNDEFAVNVVWENEPTMDGKNSFDWNKFTLFPRFQHVAEFPNEFTIIYRVVSIK